MRKERFALFSANRSRLKRSRTLNHYFIKLTHAKFSYSNLRKNLWQHPPSGAFFERPRGGSPARPKGARVVTSDHRERVAMFHGAKGAVQQSEAASPPRYFSPSFCREARSAERAKSGS
jgi:hypothetical protein